MTTHSHCLYTSDYMMTKSLDIISLMGATDCMQFLTIRHVLDAMHCERTYVRISSRQIGV